LKRIAIVAVLRALVLPAARAKLVERFIEPDVPLAAAK
jgi:hypothetical protein